MGHKHYRAINDLAKDQGIQILAVDAGHILAMDTALHIYFVQEYHHSEEEYSLDHTEPVIYDSLSEATQHIMSISTNH